MRILIIPFPKAMRGGEHHPEQLERLKKVNELWNDSFSRHAITILCSSGLANSEGISLGQTMYSELLQIDHETGLPPISPDDIAIGERESTHTGEQIRFSKTTLTDSRQDKIICVSSPGIFFLPGHIDRIKRLMRNIIPNLPVEFVACKPYGSTLYRISRGITELILIMLLWVDPQAKLLDRSRDKRIQDAKSKP